MMLNTFLCAYLDILMFSYVKYLFNRVLCQNFYCIVCLLIADFKCQLHVHSIIYCQNNVAVFFSQSPPCLFIFLVASFKIRSICYFKYNLSMYFLLFSLLCPVGILPKSQNESLMFSSLSLM